jgi:acyl-CoA thioesterase I
MTSGNLNSADFPLLCLYRRHPTRSAQAKVLLSIVSLCLLILFLASCGQAPEGQPSHASVPKQVYHASHSQITYVAIGASDTFGIGTSDPYTQNWPTDLAEKLGTKVHLINLGIPEIHIHDALSLELPVALDSHPDLVTIWLAVNDLANNVPISSYSHDLDLMLSRLQANAPYARMLIANVPDLTLLPYFSSYNPLVLQKRIQTYNAAIASVAQRHHVILIDLSQQNYNLRDHPEYISDDGLHPTDLGYVQLAELFYIALQANTNPTRVTARVRSGAIALGPAQNT